MSKIDNLIEEFCPDGVVSRVLLDICNITRGRVISNDYLRDNVGEYPVYSSQTLNDGIFGYIDNYDYDCESITWTTDGANAGSVFYHINERFSITNVCGLLRVLNDQEVNTKFLYYCLQVKTKKFVNSGMGNPKLMSNAIGRVPIPLPPLPVQQEIVRILDIFTELTAVLTAELTARKKQYEYYQNSLIYDDYMDEQKPLGDVCIFQNGFAFKSEKFTDIGSPILRITNIQDDRIDAKNLVYFDICDYKENLKQYIINRGDIVVAMSGATTGKIGFSDSDHMYYLNQRVGKFTPNTEVILNRYLYHVLKSKSQVMYQLAGGGAQPNLSSTQLKKMMIPVPSIEEQTRIVSILDRLDSLCNDLTSGLPAEIEARKKQYEYYRDKLLTFEEKPV